MNLSETLTTSASTLEEAEATRGSDGVEWSRRGQPFATLSDDGAAEFLLDEHVAAAAARTPDTTASSRGRGWVRFSPATLDTHGVDRASAWFASAYRRLTQG